MGLDRTVGAPSGLVLDASVLIDLVDCDPLLIALVAQHVAPVITPLPVLQEVTSLTEARSAELGMRILTPSLGQLSEASTPRAPLSFEDYLCLLTARDEGLTCVTNDAALAKACLAEGIDVWRGLRPIIVLVEAGVLSARSSIGIVRSIRSSNPYVTTTVVTAFVREVRVTVRRQRRRA
jgi:predicted nucleic acid-binding protein